MVLLRSNKGFVMYTSATSFLPDRGAICEYKNNPIRILKCDGRQQARCYRLLSSNLNHAGNGCRKLILTIEKIRYIAENSMNRITSRERAANNNRALGWFLLAIKSCAVVLYQTSNIDMGRNNFRQWLQKTPTKPLRSQTSEVVNSCLLLIALNTCLIMLSLLENVGLDVNIPVTYRIINPKHTLKLLTWPVKKKRYVFTRKFFEELDQAMLSWFNNHRQNNVPTSGPIVKAKEVCRTAWRN
ncbi:hypothetical protein WA026_001573 [Henosepilachna vigintioctopunctata]|uniref:Uncharacterized protein n=1 Tax=Henosepilachna vigintioctopunctata TaxID=420089 RepID=A0AAW1URK8_9CUCU